MKDHNSLNRYREKKKLSKEDLAFWESVKDLPPLERATRCSLRWGNGVCQWKKTDERFEKVMPHYSGDDRNAGCSSQWWDKCDCEFEDVKSFLHSELEKVRQETIEMLADKVQENRKGTFTDDAGYDCWYIDDLVKFIKSLSINKKEQ